MVLNCILFFSSSREGSLNIFFFNCMGQGLKSMTKAKNIQEFYSNVLSKLHLKLKCEAFLRTKGTAETSCAREPQYCHCCLLKSRCRPNSWWRKITLVKCAVCTKWPVFFVVADNSFNQNSFVPTAAWPTIIRKVLNSIFGCRF